MAPNTLFPPVPSSSILANNFELMTELLATNHPHFALTVRGRMLFALLFGCLLFSSRAMAVPGCGDDGVGDIGTPTPISVTAGTPFAFNYSACFTGGNTTGWNHTIAVAPAHGTLTIVGSLVTYTPNAGFVGADFWQISPLSLALDGALNDACSCNLTGTFSITAPPPTSAIAAPAMSEWGFLSLTLLLAGMGYFTLKHQWRGPA
jgi:hypothetical protein